MNEDAGNSVRKRPRSRNRSKGNSGNLNVARQHPETRRRKATPKIDPIEFWGDPESLPSPCEVIEHAPDARALLNSLGRPPVPGQETAAERWFTLVYERAAFLAGALAAAGELDRTD